MLPSEPTVDSPARLIAFTLRVLGAIDLLALVAVVMPADWMAWTHAWTGLGTLPAEPVVGYLARTASVLYASHGLLIIYVSCDVRRYWPLIRFLAAVSVLHGLVVFVIDGHVGMPRWWTCVEGPGFAATGLWVLVVQHWPLIKPNPRMESRSMLRARPATPGPTSRESLSTRVVLDVVADHAADDAAGNDHAA